MTREEAKEILTHNWTRVDNPNYSESELDEAFFMAIEALSASSGDVISRADAIETIMSEPMNEPKYPIWFADKLKELPSAEVLPIHNYGMRLIDAEALKAKWYKINDIDENDRGARFVGYTEIARLIDEAPTVELVRCKDCRHRYEEGDNTHYYWCRLNDRPIDDTDYCAWAERREP